MSAIPLFVISLRGSPHRARISEQLRRCGISFELIDAIEGAALAPDELARLYDEQATLARVGRPLGRNEIGCALSHRLVYRKMLDQHLPSAVILEDDAQIGEDFVDIWRRVHLIPDVVELLSFCTAHGFVMRRPEASVGPFGLHRAASPLSLTVGYFIRAGAARKLNNAPRVESVADWPVEHGDVRHFLAIPMPVGHPPHHSALAQERARLQEHGARSLPFRLGRALIYLTFLPFCFRRSEYMSLRNYIDREVGWRLLRHLSPFFIDVAKLSRQISPAGL